METFSPSHQAPTSVEDDGAGEGQSRVWEQVSAVRSTGQGGGRMGNGQGGGRERQNVRRVAAAAASATLLCFVCALAVPEFQQWAQGSWPGKVGLLGTKAGGVQDAMVQKMYQEDPSLVKAWAKLSGSKQARIMLADAEGKKPDSPHFQSLDKDMKMLDSGISHVEEHLQAKIEKPMLPSVNRNAAWMVVQDLSSHWDANANYTAHPWQFCQGRHLSRRQLRDCAHHLILAAGVKYHRDLNIDSKIYQLMCTNTGHTYIDNRGSTYALPAGTQAACDRIVTARSNVDLLLKRQVTKFKSHVDQNGHVTPPRKEKDGSHGVACKDLEIGC